MNFQAFNFIFLCVLGLLIQPTLQDNQCELTWPECCFCGRPINVTLIARNTLQGSSFDFNVTVSKHGGTLLSFLEQAVGLENGFLFKSTYSAQFGYFIDTINGVASSISDKKFWHIISVTGRYPLECGVSSYVPKDDEVILFNFTTYAAAGYDF